MVYFVTGSFTASYYSHVCYIKWYKEFIWKGMRSKIMWAKSAFGQFILAENLALFSIYKVYVLNLFVVFQIHMLMLVSSIEARQQRLSIQL